MFPPVSCRLEYFKKDLVEHFFTGVQLVFVSVFSTKKKKKWTLF